MEQIAAYISLFGVVLIARPVSLLTSLSHSSNPMPSAGGDDDFISSNKTAGTQFKFGTDHDAATSTQRATAVGIAMLGVFGAAGAYTTIRWIGKRAHPLISVNYFATWCTIVSIVAMLTVPGVGFLLPRNLNDWCYLIVLGVCGFIMVSKCIMKHVYMINSCSNSFLLLAFSTRNHRVQRIWYICKCYSHLLSIS
jgi:hypothetical protein